MRCDPALTPRTVDHVPEPPQLTAVSGRFDDLRSALWSIGLLALLCLLVGLQSTAVLGWMLP